MTTYFTYKCVGRIDGRWTVLALDENKRPVGIKVEVSTQKEAWNVVMLLSGREMLIDDDLTVEIETREAS